MNIISITLALAALLYPTAPEAAAPIAAAQQELVFGRDWVARAVDSICGLRDVNQVSNPATVDFQACLDATPEMKKARQDKIGLDTPEGIRLLNEATNRVTDACEVVRSSNGYCSVWKAIKHKDGRAVSDVTELVKAQY